MIELQILRMIEEMCPRSIAEVERSGNAPMFKVGIIAQYFKFLIT